MSLGKCEVVVDPAKPRITMKRAVNAPRSLVFDAFTKPELVSKWKGPRVAEVTLIELDLRVGGKWRVNYRLPNGADMGFHGEFSEVVKPERLVRTFCFVGKPGQMIETLIFEERSGGTLVTTISDFDSMETRDAAAAAMGPGMDDTYERLDELLTKLAA